MSKISELPILTQADVDVYSDVVPVLDASANVVKKIPLSTIQGYTNNPDPYADIASLCVSDYTISEAKATVLSGKLIGISAIIHNGETGIPAVKPQNEVLFGVPKSLFVNLYRYGCVVSAMSDIPPNAFWSLDIAGGWAMKGTTENHLLFGRVGNFNDPNIFPAISSYAKYSNGNIKGLYIYILAREQWNVNELPYSV